MCGLCEDQLIWYDSQERMTWSGSVFFFLTVVIIVATVCRKHVQPNGAILGEDSRMHYETISIMRQ